MTSKYDLVKKPSRRVFSSIRGTEGSYQCDIAFVQYSESPKMRKINGGKTCFLVVVEIPTRYAYVVPLAGKGQEEVSDAFAKVYMDVVDHGSLFLQLTHDDGSEFDNVAWNRTIKELPKSMLLPPIQEFVKEPGDRYSLGTIDSLTRTLKRFIEDYLIEHETLDWVSAMPEILKKYNEHQIAIETSDKKGRKHLGIRASPKKLREYGSEFEKAQQCDEDRGRKGKQLFDKFKVGDKVRIRLRPGDQPRANSRLAKPGDLAKGCDRWSNKVYQIVAIEGYSFELNDSQGQAPARTYRAHELLKVGDNSADVPDIFEKVASEARREKRRVREGLD